MDKQKQWLLTTGVDLAELYWWYVIAVPIGILPSSSSRLSSKKKADSFFGNLCSSKKSVMPIKVVSIPITECDVVSLNILRAENRTIIKIEIKLCN